MAKIYQTPGVYIEEKSAFPNSAVPVATALPAFIGYTEKAERDKKTLLNKPTKISSYGEYLMFFGGPPRTTLTIGNSEDDAIPYTLTIKGNHFTLHSQMKMFFSNGGSDCYIVSVGSYDDDFDFDKLKNGITPLLKEPEPAMLVIPDAATGVKEVSQTAHMHSVYTEMLKHCGVDMRSRFAITDVWMDRSKYALDSYNMNDDVERFRNGIGTNNLQWAATYYPWLHTTAISADEISMLNVDNLGTADQIKTFTDDDFEDKFVKNPADFRQKYLTEEVSSLVLLLDKALNKDVLNGLVRREVAEEIKSELLTKIPAVRTKNEGATDALPVVNESAAKELHQSLLAVSTMYKSVMADMRKELNLLPPSGAMAGIYSMVDNTVGVFQSPANVSVGSVVKPAVNISNEQQEDLNIPLNGKAVNAIRSFPGKGTLVWGARTLDGNSQDWRYISVRRTVIFIEQYIKYAAEPYVFEPNTAATWSNMKALLVNFLTHVWQSGALAGATAEDAFSVDVGLGTTMTPVDILDGYMRISVKIAVTRPAEFIVITFEQKMQQS